MIRGTLSPPAWPWLAPKSTPAVWCCGYSNIKIVAYQAYEEPCVMPEITQGVAMLSSVLRRPRAGQVSIEILWAFVRLR